jgi:hypothetical protein
MHVKIPDYKKFARCVVMRLISEYALGFCSTFLRIGACLTARGENAFQKSNPFTSKKNTCRHLNSLLRTAPAADVKGHNGSNSTQPNDVRRLLNEGERERELNATNAMTIVCSRTKRRAVQW